MLFKNWLESEIPSVPRTSRSGRTLYHGTILAKYLKIVAEGKIKSWDDNEIEKSSSGNMYEGGLIWFFEDKEPAWTYAHGREYRKAKFSPGGIIEVDVPYNLKFIDRYAKLTEQQAAELVKYYPDWRQRYKPIKTGLELEYAVWRIWETEKISFSRVLKILNLDGIIYEEQIGIAAKELPVAAAYPV